MTGAIFESSPTYQCMARARPGDTHDAIVIGGGSAGVRFARVAASLGASIALVHGQSLGGTCVNEGCIPKKLLSYGAHLGHDLRHGAGVGWQAPDARLDWPTLRDRTAAEVRRLNGLYEDMLANAGVECLRGFGQLAGRGGVQIRPSGGVTVANLMARTIVIATGGTPRRPHVRGAHLLATSTDAFQLDRLPRALAVLGGGYIACELASIFAGLGSDVTLVHRGARLLRGFDDEAVDVLTAELARQGVRMRMHTTVEAVDIAGTGRRLKLNDGSLLSCDTALAAVGRDGASHGLGLENAGLQADARGQIAAGPDGDTGAAGVYAIGDVASPVQLTPVATRAGERLAHRLFGEISQARPRADAFSTPTAVFTHPALATCGLGEQQALDAGHTVDIYSSAFAPLRSRLVGDGARALCKLVVERRTQRVLGAHVVADDAPELIQGFAVAVHAGMTKPQFDATLGVHPSVAEELVTLRNARPARAQP